MVGTPTPPDMDLCAELAEQINRDLPLFYGFPPQSGFLADWEMARGMGVSSSVPCRDPTH